MATYEVLAPGGHEALINGTKAYVRESIAGIDVSGQKLTKAIEGTTLTIDDAYTAPLTRIKVYGNSVQNGTPAPDAPVPINSVDALTLEMRAKNLLPSLTEETTVNGITFTPNSDGSVHISGTATAVTTVPLTRNGRLDNSGSLFGGDLLTLSGAPDGSSETYCLRVNYYTNKTGGTSNHAHYVTSGMTLSRANSSWYWAYISIYVTSGTTVNATIYPQLERGAAATSYEPYVGTSTPIDLQGNRLHMVEFGSTDRLTLDYLHPSTTQNGYGVYSVTLRRNIVTRSLSELDISTYSSGKTFKFTVTPNPPMKQLLIPELFGCTGYVKGAAAGISTTLTDNTIHRRGTSGQHYNVFMIRDADYVGASVADFKAARGDIEIDYRVDNVIDVDLGTVELPPLPASCSTVWTTGGSADPSKLEVTYERDINMAIAEIEHMWAQLAPVEQATATTNHAVGTYLVLDGTFCKVTSAIATGEAVAIGTNVAATTIAAEILAIQA